MIDFHTHCFPESIAKKAMDAVSCHGEIPRYAQGTPKDLQAQMAATGIHRAVVLNIATNPRQQSKVNDFARETNGETLVAFGSVHPGADDAREEIGRIKQMGLSGVKFHPEYQEFDCEDTRHYPLYEACFEQGLIMTFHAGRDIAFPQSNRAHPRALQRICEHLPQAKIVLAHLGGWQQWAQVSECLVGKNCYFDTSMTQGYLPPEQMRRLITSHGVDKILFGTDSPWTDLQQSIDYIDSLGLPSADQDRIYHENAAQLLGRTGGNL